MDKKYYKFLLVHKNSYYMDMLEGKLGGEKGPEESPEFGKLLDLRELVNGNEKFARNGAYSFRNFRRAVGEEGEEGGDGFFTRRFGLGPFPYGFGLGPGKKGGKELVVKKKGPRNFRYPYGIGLYKYVLKDEQNYIILVVDDKKFKKDKFLREFKERKKKLVRVLDDGLVDGLLVFEVV